MPKTEKQMEATYRNRTRWEKYSVLGGLAMSRRNMLNMLADDSLPPGIRFDCQETLDRLEKINRDMRGHLGVKPQ